MALPHLLQRVLIIAPHPDDDIIAAGGLMQHIVAAGGELRVLFVTDGDNNPWPQRFLQRKWLLEDRDRAEWGATRRREALCSLSLLGIPDSSATFLALPDSAIADIARRGDTHLTREIQSAIADLQPTLVVSPSAFDLHSDHRAVSFFVHRAAADAAIVTYVVHGRAPSERLALRIALSDRERLRKSDAIGCHRSQLALSRRRFLGYARGSESFYSAEFDLVRLDSPFRRKLIDIRYGARVVFGLDPAPEESGPPLPLTAEPSVHSSRIK